MPSSYVECSTIEHYEDPDRDWRHAFRKTLEGVRTQLVQERSELSHMTYDVFGRTVRARDLNDRQLEVVAHDYAVRRVEEAIRRHHSEQIVNRVKTRRSRAK